ncbi:hypothetical protein [Nostoc sp. CHAB 5715]|nr:hypothetical protein [Nostoc sp. CHAB 5715]
MGNGEWGIGHWALVINFCPSLPHSLISPLPTPHSPLPILQRGS